MDLGAVYGSRRRAHKLWPLSRFGPPFSVEARSGKFSTLSQARVELQLPTFFLSNKHSRHRFLVVFPSKTRRRRNFQYLEHFFEVAEGLPLIHSTPQRLRTSIWHLHAPPVQAVPIRTRPWPKPQTILLSYQLTQWLVGLKSPA